MSTTKRVGVFETNSSSTHSISIAYGDFIPQRNSLPVEGGVCRVYLGEFGWEVENYNDAATKASYCAVFSEGNDGLRRRLSAVIESELGASVEFCGSGYIDHQSDSVCAEAFETDGHLRAFIFNPKSTLTTDNDNH